MDDGADLKIQFSPNGKSGKGSLSVRLPGGDTHTDLIDIRDAKARSRFVAALAKGRKGIDRQAVSKELERIAAGFAARVGGDGAENKRLSQADILVGLAQGMELFHTPGGHDSEGFATVKVGDHFETWPIQSKGFQRWLAKLFHDSTGKAPGSQAIQDAVNVIAGKAVHQGDEKEIAVRLAQTSEGIWLDLADEKWQAVHISSTGWRVVTEPPVKFIRKRGMLALPVPTADGKIDMLRELVNLPDDDSWRLFVAWLVAALRPDRPFPILVVNGEQGSAKSCLCRIARALIDPNKAPLRRPPRQDRDLLIAATNGWIVAFDNLSGLPPSLSDALCMLATGGGFGTRKLYTDADEKLFDATRPVMVNGIEDLATRSDLLDRALTLILPTIPDHQRRDEEELWRQFFELQPKILGALLDAVAVGLKNLPNTKLAKKPRMADFARWIVAAEPALGWPAGGFMAAYHHNRGAANALALEASVIGPPILALVGDVGTWQGTASALLTDLEARVDEPTSRRKEWPTSPRKLSGELRRLAPNLRKEGINVDFDRAAGGKRQRNIWLEQVVEQPSPSSRETENPAPQREQLMDDGDACLVADRSAPGPGKTKVRDDGDGVLTTQSEFPNADEVMEWTA